MILALLSSTAAAKPQTTGRLTWLLSSIGAGHVDDVTGLVWGWSMEPAIVHRKTQLGLELGMSWVCPLSFADCDRSTFDVMLGVHVRRRLHARSYGWRSWWLGGGVSAHRLERRVEPDLATTAHGELEPAKPATWQPGVDLQLTYELKAARYLGTHFGLRSFVIRRDDATTMAKPIAGPPAVYGVDGGVVLELGYIYGR